MKSAPATVPQAVASAASSPVCKRCGSLVFERLQRVSVLQRRIMPFFNLYPWRCVICNKLTYYTARNTAELQRRSQQRS